MQFLRKASVKKEDVGEEQVSLADWKYLVSSNFFSLMRLLLCLIILAAMVFAVYFWTIPSQERWVAFIFQAISSIVGGCIIGISSKLIEPALLAATARDGFTLLDLNYKLGWSGGILGCVGFITNPILRKNKLWRWGFSSAFFMLLSGSLTALIFTEGPSPRIFNCLVSNRTDNIGRDITGATLSPISDAALGVLVTSWSKGDEVGLVKSRAFQSSYIEVNSQAIRAAVLDCAKVPDGNVTTDDVNQYKISTLNTGKEVLMWPKDMLGLFFTSNSKRRLGVHINSPDWNNGTPSTWICSFGAVNEQGAQVNCDLKEYNKVCSTLDWVNGVGFNYNWNPRKFPNNWLMGGYNTSPVVKKLLTLKNTSSVVKAVVWAHLEAAFADVNSASSGNCRNMRNVVQVRLGVAVAGLLALLLGLIGVAITCKLACKGSPQPWMDSRVGAIFKNGISVAPKVNFGHETSSYAELLKEKNRGIANLVIKPIQN